jgi:hypothetical protein
METNWPQQVNTPGMSFGFSLFHGFSELHSWKQLQKLAENAIKSIIRMGFLYYYRNLYGFCQIYTVFAGIRFVFQGDTGIWAWQIKWSVGQKVRSFFEPRASSS